MDALALMRAVTEHMQGRPQKLAQMGYTVRTLGDGWRLMAQARAAMTPQQLAEDEAEVAIELAKIP